MLAYRVEPVPGDPHKFMIFDKETGDPVNFMDRMVTQEQLEAVYGYVPADQVKAKVQELGRAIEQQRKDSGELAER